MSTYYTDNLDRDIDRYLEDQDRWLRRRPRCEWCDENIQGLNLWLFNENPYCADCLEGLMKYADTEEPVYCCECGNAITDEFWTIEDRNYCADCVATHKRYTDDFI